MDITECRTINITEYCIITERVMNKDWSDT